MRTGRQENEEVKEGRQKVGRFKEIEGYAENMERRRRKTVFMKSKDNMDE